MFLATPPEDPTRFVPLLIVLVLAFFVPIFLSRFQRIPVVVGEILAGVIVGPSILGLVTDGPIITFMADIGLAFLMFLAGMEIDFSVLFPPGGRDGKKNGPNPAGLAVWVYVATLLLAIPGAIMINRLGLEGDVYLLIFILSATSLGVLLPILKERNMLQEKFGMTIFITAMLADFVTVILLTIYLITFDKGFDPEIFSLGLLFIAFLLFYRFGPNFIRIPSVRNFFEDLSKATVQIKVRGAIAILMTFVVLAEFVDAELILGAFLGGMIISLLKGPQDEGLVHKLEAFGFGFFIPVFFIIVGVDLDLEALMDSPESLLTLPEFFAIAMAVKLLPMFLIKRHFSWKQVFAGGFLLNTHLSLEIAVAVVGLRAGLFDAATSTTVILFAVTTVLIMPLLFGWLLPYVEEKLTRFTVIVGINDMGLKVAQEMRTHGDKVRFLESDPVLAKQASEDGFEIISQAPTPEALESLPMEQINSLLVLSDDDDINFKLSRKAKRLGAENVVAIVRDPKHLPDFQEAGVNPFTPAIQRATMISMMARNPDALTLLSSTTDDRDTREIHVDRLEMKGRKLRDLQMPGNVLVLAIRRGEQLIIPRGDTELEMRDRITLLGEIDDLNRVQATLER